MIVRVAPVLFVSLTPFAALFTPTVTLPKFPLVGENATVGVVPVPDRVTLCGLLEALSVTTTVPAFVPVAVGVKVTEIVQFAPAATEVPHVLVWA